MTAIEVNRELLDVAERLAAEYDVLPAGSLLRCFARAVRQARTSGISLPALPAASEALARTLLGARGPEVTKLTFSRQVLGLAG